MRIGILGGTFDPVHYGHLMMAESCREQLQLDEVRLIPAGDPPHKPDQKITDAHARADMLQLAVSGYPEFVVDRREIRRSGPSFTVDTLQEFREQQPDDELFLIIGADSLEQLLTWKSPEQIAQLATIVAVNRPTQPELTTQQITQWVGGDIAASVQTVAMPGSDLSASWLRERLAAGKSLRFLTPKAVEAFIAQHDIYAAAPPAAP
ncbi:MAG: nicotinate-nucleotide adenylyltransferase [Planctomycetaceae bacterium]|nr:nicotinate-nucleotide adenylyltransferase [Planctomycetaceae bacterium]